jgi:hypothetical protein
MIGQLNASRSGQGGQASLAPTSSRGSVARNPSRTGLQSGDNNGRHTISRAAGFAATLLDGRVWSAARALGR